MSGFSMKNKAEGRTFPEDVLYQNLDKCTSFKFIPFKHIQMPLRHTGFLLFFDNVPLFTINVQTAKTTGWDYLQSLVVTQGRVTVGSAEDLGQVQYVGLPVVHTFRPSTDPACQREAARRDIAVLLTPQPWYSLFWKNCRDHVRSVMSCLEDHHPGMGDAAHQDLQQTRAEDTVLIVRHFRVDRHTHGHRPQEVGQLSVNWKKVVAEEKERRDQSQAEPLPAQSVDCRMEVEQEVPRRAYERVLTTARARWTLRDAGLLV
ncbi:uncharacterized protein LOC119106264 [Pollicipes pollicipes]|uniref:uncharacterized protein LOC119106264 n=1 Tax=Pollicipes pollicipes TaxID=41117 RepID=UPI001884A8F8|nr:uncharacterized protein LOC119106264 [Pollicipes pollicipes]